MKEFTYQFDAGPFATLEELLGDWEFGNCRRAVQLYIYLNKDIFLAAEDVLCPRAYHHTGMLVPEEGASLETLENGDIIYAEKIRKKNGELVDKSPRAFTTEDDYIISLHTSLYTGELNKEIWHATGVEGASCFWDTKTFLYFYKPVRVRRVG